MCVCPHTHWRSDESANSRKTFYECLLYAHYSIFRIHLSRAFRIFSVRPKSSLFLSFGLVRFYLQIECQRAISRCSPAARSDFRIDASIRCEAFNCRVSVEITFILVAATSTVNYGKEKINTCPAGFTVRNERHCKCAHSWKSKMYNSRGGNCRTGAAPCFVYIAKRLRFSLSCAIYLL